ncbi:alpha-1A adrenergic receptor-like [Actinia tenebrosa]|uniref:Alpha-1A adrenergic receptor-like n=1 Tax=Actinia tenebrosa TaxID=6105 RepID=A0A6P8I1T6_ACTTE|nr:alpha-1A adrenergic receptor-like [Actinia tenebrosa]
MEASPADSDVPQVTQPSSTNYGKSPTSFTTITQVILVGCLALVSLTGNSTVCILMKRFKSIRTIPNMFLANLAIVDMFNILINLPLFTIVGVLEFEETLHGRWVSLAVASAQNLFNVLKITSMVVTMTDRYIAISWGLRYYIRKTKAKAARALCVVWLLSITITLPWVILASQLNLGDVPTYKYRIAYFNEIGRTASFFIYLMFGLATTLLSVLTFWSYKRKLKKFAKLRKEKHDSQETQLDRARTRSEVQAAWTIGLIIAAYILCYVPCILYAAVGPEEMLSSNEIKWFGFAANFFLYFSSGCNPLIYLARTTRFRAAVKQLLKNPFGSDDVKLEKPRGLINNVYKVIGVFQQHRRIKITPLPASLKKQNFMTLNVKKGC